MNRTITAQRLMLREALATCPQLDVDAEIASHFVGRHGYRNALARVDRLLRAVHSEGKSILPAATEAGFEAAPMIVCDDEDFAERMTPKMRIAAAIMVALIAGVLVVNVAWSASRTVAGICAHHGEWRG